METTTQTRIGIEGDPFVAAALADMTPSQRDRALREHYAPDYVRRLRRILQSRCEEPGEDDE
jgi:hypothetical protein